MNYLVLAGGSVVDGTGAEPVVADVRFDASGVHSVGRDIARHGDRVVRVDGHTVMPGFIDTHVHAASLLTSKEHPGDTAALLAQGVTTVILGGDGFAACCGSVADLEFTSRYFGGIDGIAPHGVDGSVSSLLDHYDGFSVNVALLIPANTVRHAVLGTSDVTPSTEQIRQMAALVDAGMAAGALGIATGLDYIPGRFASDEEVAALCVPVAEWGGVHASHMRGYGAAVGEGLAGLARVQELSGVATHIAHLRATAGAALELLPSDVTFDSYPYQRGCTLLAMRVLPPEVQTGSLVESIELLRSTSGREMLSRIDPSVGDYVLSSSAGSAWSRSAGLTLSRAAAAEGLSLGELVRAVLIGSELSATCIVPGSPHDGTEEDYAALLRDPRQMGCSDGIYLGEHPHPRGWGAFARVLSRHVRERGDLTLGQAAAHLAGHAASRFALDRRGVIAVGNHADLVVVDPDLVSDRATYDSPRAAAGGVTHVFVNGVEVYTQARTTGASPGRALRRGLRQAA